MKKGILIMVPLFFLMIIAISQPGMEEGNSSRSFKLAMIQMEVKGGEMQKNIHHAVELIEEAAANGAELALLPECLDLGWTHPSSLTFAEPIPGGEPCNLLMEAAKQNDIYVCAGLTEMEKDHIYNTAVMIDNNGVLIGTHRKLNEVLIGHDYYEQGDRLNVIETDFGKVGMMICADGFAEDRVLARSLGYMGADVILSPCAWAVSADHDNEKDPYGGFWRYHYTPVAKDFLIPIVGVSNVGWITGGPWEGMQCIGSSLAIDAAGEDILQGPYGVDAECILYVEIQIVERPARGNGWQKYWEKQE